MSLINSIYFISGVYSLLDLRHTKSVNDGNLLSITNDNVLALSPLYHDFSHLKDFNINFKVFVAENDSYIFKNQSKDMHQKFEEFSLKTSLEILEDLDHFDIVENMTEPDFIITKKLLGNND